MTKKELPPFNTKQTSYKELAQQIILYQDNGVTLTESDIIKALLFIGIELEDALEKAFGNSV